jgi:hypothetical protein
MLIKLSPKKLLFFIGHFLDVTMVIACLLVDFRAQAWGERGHHLIGHTAALLMESFSDKEAVDRGLPAFFKDRAHQFGHLSNLPDISWRETSRQSQGAMLANGPTHFIDLELLVGLPTKDNKASYQKLLLGLPLDYSEVRRKFEGTPNPILPSTASPQPLKVYFDVGSAPWRVRELFEKMAAAFACAKGKETGVSSQLIDERPKWHLPIISQEKPPSLGFNYYSCTKEQTRLEAISAALAIGGVMGHFVGDLTQPYHTTVNYDGWGTGNGKAHEYFESAVVNSLELSIENEVYKMAKSTSLKHIIEKGIEVDWKTKGAASAFALGLAANSWSRLDEAIQIDKKYAIVPAIETKDSSAPQQNEPKKESPPLRHPASSQKVIKAFTPLLLERLAIGSRALAKIWYQAWIEGGKPNLADVRPTTIPYILDVPFLRPTYDEGALKNLSSKKDQ